MLKNKVKKIYVTDKIILAKFPTKEGINLFEDENGKYFKHGELIPHFDEDVKE